MSNKNQIPGTPTPAQQHHYQARTPSSSWQSTPRKLHLWVKRNYPSSAFPSNQSDKSSKKRTSQGQQQTPHHQPTLDQEFIEQSSSWTVDDALSALSSYRDEFPVLTVPQPHGDDHQYQDDDYYQGRHDLEIQKTQSLLHQLNWEGKYSSTQHYHCHDDDDDENNSKNNVHPDLLLQFGSSLGQQEYRFAVFDEANISLVQPQEDDQVESPANDNEPVTPTILYDDDFGDFQDYYFPSTTMPTTIQEIPRVGTMDQTPLLQKRQQDKEPAPVSILELGPSKEMNRTLVMAMGVPDQASSCFFPQEIDRTPILSSVVPEHEITNEITKHDAPTPSHNLNRPPLEEDSNLGSHSSRELGSASKVATDHMNAPGRQVIDRTPLEEINCGPSECLEQGLAFGEVHLPTNDPTPAQPQVMDRTPPEEDTSGYAASLHNEHLQGNANHPGPAQVQVMDRTPPQEHVCAVAANENHTINPSTDSVFEREQSPPPISSSTCFSNINSTPGGTRKPETTTPIANNYSQVKQRRIQETPSNSPSTTTSRNSEPQLVRSTRLHRPSLSSPLDLATPPRFARLDRDTPPYQSSTQSSTSVPSVVQLIATHEVPRHHYDTIPRIPTTVRAMVGTPFSIDTQDTHLSSISSPPYHNHSHRLHNEDYQQSLVTPLRLSLQLDRQVGLCAQATSSWATPEGRFIRRSSQMRQFSLDDTNHRDDDHDDRDTDENNDASSLGTASLGSLRSFLPVEFKGSAPNSAPDSVVPSDAVLEQMLYDTLNELEWDWIPYWKMESLLEKNCDESFVPLWLEQITQQLSEMDATYSRLTKKLYQRIQPRERELESANQATLALAKNLQLCEMYLKRSQESVRLAKVGSKATNTAKKDGGIGGGVEGAWQLLKLWDTQESYSIMDELLARVTCLFEKEKLLLERIDHFHVQHAVSLEQCRTLLVEISDFEEQLSSTDMSSFQCLQDLKERVSELRGKNLVGRLHSWLVAITVRCCHASVTDGNGFDPVEYRRLIETILLTELGDDPAYAGVVAGSICSSIHSSLLLEAQKSFGMALLSPSSTENEDSEYEKELLALSTNAYLDPSRMAIWTHNLVTIRFDFELQKNHFPAVVHKLCWQLTNILRSHHVIMSWHKRNDGGWNGAPFQDSVMMGVVQELAARRSSIWNACVKVLEDCMEEYLKFAPKKKLFQWGEDGRCNDWIWFADLVGLQDVEGLIQQFFSLMLPFLGEDAGQSVNEGTMLREKINDIIKKHVRSVQIEAMTTTGTILYKEEWECKAVDASNAFDGHAGVATIDALRSTISRALEVPTREVELRCERNHFCVDPLDGSLLLVADRNPFDLINSVLPPSHRVTRSCDCRYFDLSLAKLLQSYVHGALPTTPLSLQTPSCFAKAIFPWIGRILLLTERLGSASGQALEILTGISNLYLTTAFRIATGSARHERFLLGMDSPAPTVKPEDLSTNNAPRLAASQGSSVVFGFGRRPAATTPSSNSAPSTTLSTTTEAEICSPLLSEADDVKLVSALILKAQDELKSIAKLDLVDQWVVDPIPSSSRNLAELVCQSARVLEKRQVALWGCAFLAASLEIALEIIANRDETGGNHFRDFTAYVYTVSRATPKLIEIGSRLSCIRAIRGRVIVQQILLVGQGWEEAKLHGHPNEYIDSVCNYMAMLWCSLYNAKKIPPGAIESVWAHAVEGAFVCLLEGFSRVPYCSTEGRSLMSMDVTCFAGDMRGRGLQERLKGHASAPMPPTVATERGLAYVDTYIKIFYFPPMDALGWIKENFTRYQRNHMVALILGSATGSSENRVDSISNLVRTVRSLYGTAAVTAAAEKAKIAAV